MRGKVNSIYVTEDIYWIKFIHASYWALSWRVGIQRDVGDSYSGKSSKHLFTVTSYQAILTPWGFSATER